MGVPLPPAVTCRTPSPEDRRSPRMLAMLRRPTVSWGMTMSPEHINLHRMVDRLDPDQVRALCAVAQHLLRSTADSSSGETHAPEPESLLADEPVRDFSFIGLFNGAPDLAERSGKSCARNSRSAPAAIRSRLMYRAAPGRLSPRPRQPWRAGHRRSSGP